MTELYFGTDHQYGGNVLSWKYPRVPLNNFRQLQMDSNSAAQKKEAALWGTHPQGWRCKIF
jgi:hypothetical protein